MISLLIETSTERGFIAFFKQKSLIYHAKFPQNIQNSTTLFPEIVKGFHALKINPTDVQLMMSGVGPGSYTGIRVGAMTAKAFAFALKIPLVGVCSLIGFVPDQEGVFASVIDARIGGAYVQTAEVNGGMAKNFSEPKLYPLEEAVSLLKNIETIVTPNMRVLKPKFERLAQETKWNFIESDPNPVQMGLIGIEKYEKKEFDLSGQIDLLYLRKTQAEIESKS